MLVLQSWKYWRRNSFFGKPHLLISRTELAAALMDFYYAIQDAPPEASINKPSFHKQFYGCTSENTSGRSAASPHEHEIAHSARVSCTFP